MIKPFGPDLALYSSNSTNSRRKISLSTSSAPILCNLGNWLDGTQASSESTWSYHLSVEPPDHSQTSLFWCAATGSLVSTWCVILGFRGLRMYSSRTSGCPLWMRTFTALLQPVQCAVKSPHRAPAGFLQPLSVPHQNQCRKWICDQAY